jgi:hypothetical protein
MPLTATMLMQSCLAKALPLLRLAIERWQQLQWKGNPNIMTILKRNIFLFLLSPMIGIGQTNYTLDTNKINYYLSDSSLPKIVKEYFNGHFTAKDDDKTFILLDTLTSKNDHFFPFYFSIFNSIVNKSDGALSEVMGEYCFKCIYHYPKETFLYFTENNNYIKLYAFFIGYELYFKESGTSDLKMNFSQFIKYLNNQLNLKDKKIKSVFDDFTSQMKEAMNNMN